MKLKYYNEEVPNFGDQISPLIYDGLINGLKFKKHKPGVRIKENSIRYWCSHLDKFKGW